jgi:uncharacterized UPF0160 family protein
MLHQNAHSPIHHDFTKIPHVVTHNGEFHADDVVGVTLLELVYGTIVLERTRALEPIQKADFVLDVGGVFDPKKCRFDHHQKEYHGDLASAGMVLQWLSEHGKMDASFARYLGAFFITGVDRQDTGEYEPQPGICTFSDVIASFNASSPDTSEGEHLSRFKSAMEFTTAFIKRILARYQERQKYQGTFCALLDKRSQMPDRVLVMEEFIPWKEYIFEETGCQDILFVIFPHSSTKWMLHTVPVSKNAPYSNRMKLPESWAGLLEGDFVKACGIEDAIFCHKQRFIAAFKKKEAAIEASLLTIQSASL